MSADLEVHCCATRFRRRFALALAGLGRAFAQGTASINARMQGDFAPVHDPCIIKQGETYYVFCTT